MKNSGRLPVVSVQLEIIPCALRMPPPDADVAEEYLCFIPDLGWQVFEWDGNEFQFLGDTFLEEVTHWAAPPPDPKAAPVRNEPANENAGPSRDHPKAAAQ